MFGFSVRLKDTGREGGVVSNVNFGDLEMGPTVIVAWEDHSFEEVPVSMLSGIPVEGEGTQLDMASMLSIVPQQDD